MGKLNWQDRSDLRLLIIALERPDFKLKENREFLINSMLKVIDMFTLVEDDGTKLTPELIQAMDNQVLYNKLIEAIAMIKRGEFE